MIWILYTAILALAEAKPSSSLNFLVVGDWGGKPTFPFYTKAEKSVAAAMGVTAAKISSKFTIGLGDNFYYKGVTSVNDPRFQTTFEKVFTAQSLQSRWYMVCGNHDHNGNVSAQVAYTKHSKRWYMPSLYYTKTIAIPGTRSTVQFIFIDTVILAGNTDGKKSIKPHDPHPELANDELNWITKTLKHSKADWVIVAGHYPVLSASWSYGQRAYMVMVEKLKPLLEKYGVTAYFAGHHHNLQHITSDVHYFISGAGHNSKQRASVLKSSSLKYFYYLPDPCFIHGGYASVSITQTYMVVTFYNESGEELYHSAKIAPRKRKPTKKTDLSDV